MFFVKNISKSVASANISNWKILHHQKRIEGRDENIWPLCLTFELLNLWPAKLNIRKKSLKGHLYKDYAILDQDGFTKKNIFKLN